MVLAKVRVIVKEPLFNFLFLHILFSISFLLAYQHIIKLSY